jgi:hypothetical protein
VANERLTMSITYCRWRPACALVSFIHQNAIMSSLPKSNNTPTKQYQRLTIPQKVLVCKMAGVRCNDMPALSEWAARAFNMSKPPALSTLYKILKKKPELLRLHEDTYGRKKIGDPEVAELVHMLVAEFDKMEA